MNKQMIDIQKEKIKLEDQIKEIKQKLNEKDLLIKKSEDEKKIIEGTFIILSYI
jgi:hypothetical protein